MDKQNGNTILITTSKGGSLKGYYKKGRIVLRYVDLSLFLKSVNVDYELVNTMEKKTDGKRFTP
jgi:hypothetical protein